MLLIIEREAPVAEPGLGKIVCVLVAGLRPGWTEHDAGSIRQAAGFFGDGPMTTTDEVFLSS